MTTHEFAVSDLAARLAGTDASLAASLRDILTAALRVTQRNVTGANSGSTRPPTQRAPHARRKHDQQHADELYARASAEAAALGTHGAPAVRDADPGRCSAAGATTR